MTSRALPRPSHRHRRTAPAILFAVIVGLAGCVGAGGTATANVGGKPLSPNSEPMIRYELSGVPGTAEYITYEQDFTQAHETNVRLPWSKQFKDTPGGHGLLLSAQGTGSGTLTCRILLDGQLVSQATASGQPARTVCAPSR